MRIERRETYYGEVKVIARIENWIASQRQPVPRPATVRAEGMKILYLGPPTGT